MRILARLNEKVSSPAELAREFDMSLPLVSYHFKILRELGCVELVSETPVRGAVEHHYRATRRAYLSDEEWAQIDLDTRQAITGAVLRDAISDALDALQTGDMDRRDDRHVTFTPLSLDEQAWGELNVLLAQVLETALRLQAETAGRTVAGKEQPQLRSRLTILHYEPVPERSSTGSGASTSATRGRARKRAPSKKR